MNESLKRHLANEELGRRLVAPDLAEGDRAGSVMVGLDGPGGNHEAEEGKSGSALMVVAAGAVGSGEPATTD